jgi:hypothetical protein
MKLDMHVHTVHSGQTIGLPLVTLPLAAALAHFVLEERFNQSLLFDLVARPAGWGAASSHHRPAVAESARA